MVTEPKQMCPLFPETECPQGKSAVEACSVRINGEFDTVAYFKDQLVMHCALYQQEEQPQKESEVK